MQTEAKAKATREIESSMLVSGGLAREAAFFGDLSWRRPGCWRNRLVEVKGNARPLWDGDFDIRSKVRCLALEKIKVHNHGDLMTPAHPFIVS